MQDIMQIIESTNAIAYTEECANQQAQMARQQIEMLPNNPYRDALVELTNFAIARNA